METFSNGLVAYSMVVEMVQNSTFKNFIHIHNLFIDIQHMFIDIQHLFIHIQHLYVFSINIYSSST